MELAAYARKYQDFYAPAFAVRLGRTDLMRDYLIPISQVEVDLALGAAARFSFTIANCFSHESRVFRSERGKELMDLLKFGSEIEICMGYGDARSTPIITTGMITEITTNFPEDGSPELTISGHDHGYMLTLGKNSDSWSNSQDSKAARDIASRNNLAGNIEETAEIHLQIEQNQESDWEFLKKLADRNDYELFIDDRRRLFFRKGNQGASAVVKMKYGGGLLSFKPEANLAGQVSQVEVYGWNDKTQEQFVGRAPAGVESIVRGESPGKLLDKFIRSPAKNAVLRLRQPVFSQAEAQKRAIAALSERTKQFLTGEGECIGLPELRPDCNIELEDLGKPFSRKYYVQQATHKIDSSGYRTRFKVKEPKI